MSQSMPVSALPASGVAPLDFMLARQRMVDSQIRPNMVNDPRIIEAMRALPRERFVPADRAALAYMDQNVALGDGRVLTEPRVLARLLQALAPRRGERALVVAAGTGYAACLLEAMGVSVTALEQAPSLLAAGAALTRELAPSVRYVEGPLADGWAAEGPYDLILIDGAVMEIPPAFGGQLQPEGRLGAILQPQGGVAVAVLTSGSDLRARPQFDASVPLLPELRPAPQFRF